MNIRTRAAVLVATNRPLELMELVLPPPRPGQVVVQVAYSGVCQSQLLEVRGARGVDRFLPHTLGHEGAGRVCAIGEGVTKVAVGDHVVLSWIKGAGADIPSNQWEGPYGKVNSGALSTFMSHTLTCENRVTTIPNDVPLREAALLGCAVLTGVGAVLNTARARRGQSVAVFGLGGIGMSAVLGARLAEASPIIGVDVVAGKLHNAQAMGATHVIDATGGEVLEAVRRIVPRGVDIAIEAAGRTETMETAFRSVADGGGLCVIAGNVPQGTHIGIDPMDLIRGKRIMGTWGGESRPDEDIPRYVGYMLEARLDLRPLITHEMALEDVNRALDELEAGTVGRVLLDMSSLPAT